MPLTDTAIRRAQPADKPYRLFDGGGLSLEVAPSGGRWWRLKYRHGGKEKRLSLGTYPDTPLKAARERRDQACRLLAEGVDPSQARQAEKAQAARTPSIPSRPSPAPGLSTRAAPGRPRPATGC